MCLAERDEIRAAFKEALIKVWDCWIDPHDSALRNIMWDEDERKWLTNKSVAPDKDTASTPTHIGNTVKIKVEDDDETGIGKVRGEDCDEAQGQEQGEPEGDVLFEHRPAQLSLLPDPLLKRIVDLVIQAYKTNDMSDPAAESCSPADHVESYSEIEDSPTDEPTLTLSNFWANQKIRAWAERLCHLRNTYNFYFEWKSAKLTKGYEVSNDVERWLEQSPHHRDAKQINITLSFDRISLAQVRITPYELMCRLTFGRQEAANVWIHFVASGSKHSVRFDHIVRSYWKSAHTGSWLDFVDQRTYQQWAVNRYGQIVSVELPNFGLEPPAKRRNATKQPKEMSAGATHRKGPRDTNPIPLL
ncbi:hypothetical protein BU26DRAFT_566873 [Trematosphaeria pertusa]|uniref:Uncharacterized protein n=1 Tax=Trematosphaeria pertusa TaxID=390896 RepID=A0A6A6I7H0_9PLEO|nr:uncharacterized protein BU26DRAFT_566873 [Trematosphaeria pertusa]KAF2246504.1 hypothetical protein BU26DRAFT_566873 [Trematosphaeria pertusa]